MTQPSTTLKADDAALTGHSPAPARSYIQQLTLQNFRNYSWLELAMDARPVMLTGANGAGKTNILEAISLLTPGKGMRSAALTDMDMLPPALSASAERTDESARHWQVAAKLAHAKGETQLGTGHIVTAEGADKRVVRIDGEEYGQQKLAAHTSIIWLTPPMEQLFIGPATNRRKFFDRLTYSFTPSHASAVNRYEQAMRDRNKLLQHRSYDPHWCSAIEQRMVEYGVAIAAARIECAEKLNGALQAEDGVFPRGWLAIDGQVEHLVQQSTALEAESRFAELLMQARHHDARSGRTSVGPHRSDLAVEYAPKKQPARVCSTGEQKALMLSLILAVARARRVWMQAAPIVLLDEVVAHLDPARRDALFEVIEALHVQAWMTGTDPESFSGIHANARHLVVEHGAVSG